MPNPDLGSLENVNFQGWKRQASSNRDTKFNGRRKSDCFCGAVFGIFRINQSIPEILNLESLCYEFDYVVSI
jgi:hypothetical protein